MSNKFIDRKFEEVEGGYYDDYGFYYTPNGSFWDADGFYFNKEGFDKHGGYYDDQFNYIHGEGWDEKKQSYNDEEEIDFYEDDGDEDDQLDYDENYVGEEEEDIMNQVFTYNTNEKNNGEKIITDIKEEKKETYKEESNSNKPKSKLSSLFDDKPKKQVENSNKKK